jgi:outer membrane usher protein
VGVPSLLAFALGVLLQTQTPAGERAIWALNVNQIEGADIDVILRADGPWVPVDALEREGLRHIPAGRRETISGREFVSLSTLAPALRFSLDMNLVVLRLTAAPEMLPPTEVVLSRSRPTDLRAPRSRSLYFNYVATYTSAPKSADNPFSLNRTDVYGQVAASLFRPLAVFSAFAVDSNGRPQRGLSYATFDQPQSRRRWTLGDVLGSPRALSSAPLVGGFSVATNTDLDPYYVSYALPRIAGSVLAPSTASVYVGGRQISTFALRPGPFVFQQLPVASGLGRAEVILTDPSGRRDVIPVEFYLNTTLLRRGEQDYHYLAGKERTSVGTNASYGRTLGSAMHRVGLTDALTVGFQVEGDHDVISGGPSADLRLWRAGTLSLDVAASNTGTAQGWAGSAVYEFLSPGFSAAFRVTRLAEGYSNLYVPQVQQPHSYLDASAGLPLGRGSVSFAWHRRDLLSYDVTAQQPSIDRLGFVDRVPRAVLSRSLGDRRDEISTAGSLWWDRAGATVVARRVTQGGARWWEAAASMTVTLGSRAVLGVSTTHTRDYSGSQVQVAKYLPLGPGYGYRVAADTSEQTLRNVVADVDVRHGFGTVHGEVIRQSGGSVHTQLAVSGSIAMAGGRIGFVPVINDGFAVVRVPGSANVRVYANNQYIGRTNGAGVLFAPMLRSYQANSLSIAPEDLPPNVSLAAEEQQIAPSFLSGAVVVFEAKKIVWITGSVRLLQEDASIVPTFGTLEVERAGEPLQSPLNELAEFYLENVPPGPHRAQIKYRGETCTFTLTVPSTSANNIDLGVLSCTVAKQ